MSSIKRHKVLIDGIGTSEWFKIDNRYVDTQEIVIQANGACTIEATTVDVRGNPSPTITDDDIVVVAVLPGTESEEFIVINGPWSFIRAVTQTSVKVQGMI